MRSCIVGYEYDFSSPSAMTKRIKFRSRPTYVELIDKITSTIGLSNSNRISRVIYKNPIGGQPSAYW